VAEGGNGKLKNPAGFPDERRMERNEMSLPTEKEIFTTALEMPDAVERARFLDSACGGDATLRARIEKLLRVRAGSAGFLDRPAGEIPVNAPEDVGPGKSLGYFGDYVLLSEIARGASGVVFRARQSSLNRVVALKMLRNRPLLVSPDDLLRFRAEAQSAAGLDHPGIVPIYEMGEHEGQGYFSMKYIEGGALQLRVGEFREPRAAVALIAKVARAVQHAHEHGILHRDLKPGNILIARNGEPLVADFGIARQIGALSDFTFTGQIMGTPHYMAPEQASGPGRDLTVAADIYSLGAMLYELLAGKRPFAGETMYTLLKQVAERPPAPLRIGDRDLEFLVMRCMEKSPADRPGSAAVLADELERWLRGEPLKMGRKNFAAGSLRWMRRHPVRVAACVVASAAAAFFFSDKNASGQAVAPPPAGTSSSASVEQVPEKGSFAASRWAVEWLRSLGCNQITSYFVLERPDRTRLGPIKFTEDLPPGDWHLTELWLDRISHMTGHPDWDHAAFAKHMGVLTKLRYLLVRYFPCETESYAFLANNPDLEQFTSVSGLVDDKIFHYLAGLEKLHTLALQSDVEIPVKITGQGIERLKSIPLIFDLNFTASELNDATLAHVLPCKKLFQLNLSGTRVTDAGVRSLKQLPAIQRLNMGNNPYVTNASLVALAEIETLDYLDVVNTPQISEEAIAAFRAAKPKCKVIHSY
jgi:hypothetical protein